MSIYQLVGEYANTVGPHGPDSEQVRQFRATYADNAELMEYADALDRIKRHLGGRKVDPVDLYAVPTRDLMAEIKRRTDESEAKRRGFDAAACPRVDVTKLAV